MIYFSESESNILGYRVGRGSMKSLDMAGILVSSIKGAYDLVKITVPSDDHDIYSRLNFLGVPYYLVATVNVYKYNATVHKSKKDLYHPDVIFEPYDSSKIEQLRFLSREIYRDIPGSYFTNPHLRGITSIEKRLDCLVEYITGFDPAKDPVKKTFLVKHEGDYIGFISFSRNEDILESPYSGILPEKGGGGFYLDLIRFSQNRAHETNATTVLTHVQVQDLNAQKFFVREEQILHHSYLNIHVNTFFTRSVFPAKDISLKIDEAGMNSNQLLKKIQTVFLDTIPPVYLLSNICGKQVTQVKGFTSYRIRISYPVAGQDVILALTRVYDEKNGLCMYYYFEFRK